MENKHNETAEKQSLKDKLMAIILLETSKEYKKMDSDLVAECVDFLMELEGKQRLTKEEIEQRVKEIPFAGKVTALNSYAKKKLRAKRIAVIAAVLAVLITLFGMLAVGSGDAVTEFFRRVGHSVHELLDGGSKEYGNITFYKYNKTKTYSSFEDFAKNEKVALLFPSWLPENEKIVSIRYLVENETEIYLLQTEIPEHTISVEVNTTIAEDYKSNCLHKEISGISVYYRKTPQYVYATFAYKNNRYVVNSDTEDNLFRIIENLKEIN